MESTKQPDEVVGSLINQSIYFWFTMIVYITGLSGNIMVVIAFILYKKLRSLGSIFILNTAASDICVGFLGDLFILMGIGTGGDYLENNTNLCNMSSYLCASVCIVSVWSIAAASFNGYVRVCHHLAYSKIYTPITVAFMIAAMWVAGILILLPTLFGWGAHYYDPVLMFCIPSSTASVSYTYFMVFTGWGIPLLVITFSFTRIIMKVRVSNRNLKKNNDKGGLSNGEKAVIRSVMVIAVYFFAAYGFLLIILLMGDNYDGSPATVVFAVVLAHTHCSFTGVLYAATNKRYRDSYRKMFRFCYRRGKVGVESTTSSSGSTGTSGIDGAVTSVTNA